MRLWKVVLKTYWWLWVIYTVSVIAALWQLSPVNTDTIYRVSVTIGIISGLLDMMSPYIFSRKGEWYRVGMSIFTYITYQLLHGLFLSIVPTFIILLHGDFTSTLLLISISLLVAITISSGISVTALLLTRMGIQPSMTLVILSIFLIYNIPTISSAAAGIGMWLYLLLIGIYIGFLFIIFREVEGYDRG